MAQYYSYQKGKYGGVPGTITIFPRTLNNDLDFNLYLPAGYLRCDGSILKADDYIALANVIGVGDECIYKKEGTVLLNRDPETGLGGQIQLPDLGSKSITAATANTNILLDATAVDNVSNTERERVGIAVDLTLNQGSEITYSYTGNFTVPTTGVPVSGNYVLEYNAQSATARIAPDGILAHGHYGNSARLKTQSPPSVNYATFAPRIANGDVYQGEGGINVIEQDSRVVTAAGDTVGTQHEHTIRRTNPTANTTVTMNSFALNAEALTTTVTLASEDTSAFNDITQKFILVEYLIKY